MRLSQVVRKFNISSESLIRYLNSLDFPDQSLKANFKLDDKTMEKVALHFELDLKPNLEKENSIFTQETEKEDEIQNSSYTLVQEKKTPKEDVERLLNQRKVALDKDEETSKIDLLKPIKEDENDLEVDEVIDENEQVMDSTTLIELYESNENPEILQKVKRVKAKKQKLLGLKVIGKIEVEEPIQKINKKEIPKKYKSSSFKKSSDLSRQRENDEERLFLRKKREILKKKREREENLQKQKQKKIEFYEKKVKKKVVAENKKKIKKDFTRAHTSSEKSFQKNKNMRKSVFKKFWIWVNSSGYE